MSREEIEAKIKDLKIQVFALEMDDTYSWSEVAPKISKREKEIKSLEDKLGEYNG